MASFALLPLVGPASAQEMALPSGLAASLYDVVLEKASDVMAPDAYTDPEALEDDQQAEDLPLDVDPEALDEEAADDHGVAAEPGASTEGLARFRLLVQGLGGEGATYDDVAGDFLWLCEQVALPALDANGWTPSEVVISLSDREVDFGTPDPEAVQFFEGFRIADGTCVPQAF
jgi:hypothetical protein